MALKLLPFASKALLQFRNHNETRRLFRLIDERLGKAGLPAELRPRIRRQVSDLRYDPQALEALRAYLDRGEPGARKRLEARLSELLTPDSVGDDPAGIVAVVVDSVEALLNAAKRTDRTAAHLDSLRVENKIKDLSEQVGGFREGFAMFSASGLDAYGDSGPERLEPDTEREICRFAQVSSAQADHIRQVLVSGGTQALAQLALEPQEWTLAASAAFWETVGRILVRNGRLGAAEAAFLRAAELPDVEDRVRNLVRAARAAEGRGDSKRFRDLLGKARGLDAENPAVLIVDAAEMIDRDAALRSLQGITPRDARQEVELEALRAVLFLRAKDLPAAERAAQRALAADPEEPSAREVSAIVQLVEAETRAENGYEPDSRRLLSAAEVFEGVAASVRASSIASWQICLARAAVAFDLGGDSRRSNAILDVAIVRDGIYERDAGLSLATAALRLNRFEDAVNCLPDPDIATPEERLIRIEAEILAGSPDVGSDEQLAALAELLRIGRGDVRGRAAFTRLLLATEKPQTGWSEEAAAIVDGEKPWLLAMLRADFLRADGQDDEAEKLVLPHADRPEVLRQLVEYRVSRQEYDLALRFAQTLVSKAPTAQHRLLQAKIIRYVDGSAAAVRELLSIGGDVAVPLDARRAAFILATGLAQEEQDALMLEEVARAGLRNDPTGEGAGWALLQALLAQARFDDALEVVDGTVGEPPTVTEAELISWALMSGRPGSDSTERIAELSDRFGRPEELERCLLQAALLLNDATTDDRPRLEARLKETIDTFFDRFPDSPGFRQVQLDPADPTRAMAEIVRRQHESRKEILSEVESRVDKGQAAAAMLASVVSKAVGEVLLRLPALPLAFGGSESIRQAELEHARAALQARCAVWDSSAIFVVGGLGGLGEKLRFALPASMISQRVLEEVTPPLGPLRSPEGEVAWDAGSQSMLFIEHSTELREREALRAAGSLALARRLRLVPDGDDSTDDELTALMLEDLEPAIATLPAVLVAARREAAPVYSDDRWVRRLAEHFGIPSFGTLGLMDALVEVGELSEGDRSVLRQRLLLTGAWGLQPRSDELSSLAREAGWGPTPGLHAVFFDRRAWLDAPVKQFEAILGLLDTVRVERRGSFRRWVHRLVDAAAHSLGSDYEKAAVSTLLLALMPTGSEPRISEEGLRALVAEVRGLRFFRVWPPRPDVLTQAVDKALTFAIEAGLPDDARAEFFFLVVDRLGKRDRSRMIATFVEVDPGDAPGPGG